jgi:molybdopterin synthase sulfur carrier subunit
VTASIRLPRILSETVNTEPAHRVVGATVAEVFDDLFSRVPGLRNHLVDETGDIRPHVAVFVDGTQADFDTVVGDGSEIRVLHAVSGGK